MIGKNQVRAIADVQPPVHVNPGLAERGNFRHQRSRVHHRTRSDHHVLVWPKNPARNQLQHIAVFPDNDRVARIVAPSDACDVVKRSRKVVHHLDLAFIAPLCAHHNERFHPGPFLDHTSAAKRSLHHYCFGKHRWTAGSYRKLAPPSTQASRASSRRAASRRLFQILLNPLQFLLNIQVKRSWGMYDKHSSGYTFAVAPKRINTICKVPHSGTLYYLLGKHKTLRSETRAPDDSSIGNRAVTLGRTNFDCVAVTQMPTNGSYLKAVLVVAKRSHIKQLATIAECDVEFDLIIHRRLPLTYLHTRPATSIGQLFRHTESNSPDDRLPCRWPASAHSKWLSPQNESLASAGLC